MSPRRWRASRDPIGSTTVWTMTSSQVPTSWWSRAGPERAHRARRVGARSVPRRRHRPRSRSGGRRRTGRHHALREQPVPVRGGGCGSRRGAERLARPAHQPPRQPVRSLLLPVDLVSDPRGARTKIPPGGAVCGIYALTDNTTGVWKAPANEVVAGAIDLEYEVTTGAQEVLNPKGVNAIRRFPGRGIRVGSPDACRATRSGST